MIVGRRTGEHCFRSEVEKELSKSQLSSGESDRSVGIPSMVTRLNREIWWMNVSRGASMIDEKTSVSFVNPIR
jgi:hypothetical protein